VNKTWNRRYVVAVEACKVMLVYSDSALKIMQQFRKITNTVPLTNSLEKSTDL